MLSTLELRWKERPGSMHKTRVLFQEFVIDGIELRTIVKEGDRAFVLSNLKPVDAVIVFDEDNPYNTIKMIMPDILVKGADWEEDKIIGSDIVKANGGEVKRITFIEDNSSTNIIEEVLRKYCT